MAEMDVQAAIDFLIDSSGEAIEMIDAQIVELEAKLQRLKRARNVLAKANGEHKAAKRTATAPRNAARQTKQLNYWDELEQKIFDIVSSAPARVTCSDVGDQLSLNYTSIGRAINKSQRLAKEGSYIVVIA